MTTIDTVNNSEIVALDNVIHKLQIYMEQHQQTLYGLAAKMGFAYQPFYRLITKKHLPTIASLAMIAEHFDCSIAELIADDVFTDSNLFDSIDGYIKNAKASKIRLYIPYKTFIPLMNRQFFAIRDCTSEASRKKKSNKPIGELQIHVFYKVNDISVDGLFLVEYLGEKILLPVSSVSSKYVVAEHLGKEIKIEKSQITPIAQFFSYLNMIKTDDTNIIGVTR